MFRHITGEHWVRERLESEGEKATGGLEAVLNDGLHTSYCSLNIKVKVKI